MWRAGPLRLAELRGRLGLDQSWPVQFGIWSGHTLRGALYTMARHVLPNCVAPLTMLAASMFGWVILAESSLSFLGLGVPPPAPTWGSMLASARPFMSQAICPLQPDGRTGALQLSFYQRTPSRLAAPCRYTAKH